MGWNVRTSPDSSALQELREKFMPLKRDEDAMGRNHWGVKRGDRELLTYCTAQQRIQWLTYFMTMNPHPQILHFLSFTFQWSYPLFNCSFCCLVQSHNTTWYSLPFPGFLPINFSIYTYHQCIPRGLGLNAIQKLALNLESLDSIKHITSWSPSSLRQLRLLSGSFTLCGLA